MFIFKGFEAYIFNASEHSNQISEALKLWLTPGILLRDHFLHWDNFNQLQNRDISTIIPAPRHLYHHHPCTETSLSASSPHRDISIIIIPASRHLYHHPCTCAFSAMIFRRDEAPQLQEVDPETGMSGLPDSNGTWREETVVDVHRGRRRRREQVSDEEDNTEEARPRRRQRAEYDDAVDELIDFVSLERSSSCSWQVFPTLEFIPSADAPSSSEHFWWRMMMREQMNDEEDNDEEAPPLHVEQEDDNGSPPLWSLFPALACIHNMQQHSSSEHFRGRKRQREQMTEEDIVEEAPPRRRRRVEQQDDDHELSELTYLEKSSYTLSLRLDMGMSLSAWP
ncbi:uncharacterized protein LOC128605722 [Ictalurus furcatus]|uniref:uncharacterized protein LOC128605722 n=1 Tax=Ictalurus furcatus TaxID=66913 RepID=UPI00234FB71A|nr:uncharacterized protein LOC128605722 [Ictalurus furcatus]